MSGKLIFGLDVGSSKIVSIVGSVGESINVCGLSSYHFANNARSNDFSMISNGLICAVEQVGDKIAQCLHEAQISADCSPGSVIANIGGNHIGHIYTQSLEQMNNKVVTEDVIRHLVHTTKQIQIPANYEVLDYEVQEYLIDDERYAINPLELSCDSISANLNLLVAGKIPLANLKKAVTYSNYDIAKIVPSAVLSSLAVLNRDEKELGCCLIDIGAGTTDVIVYENGFIRYLASIPLGGEDITRDIASVLKIARNLAEDLKLTHGSCGYQYGKVNGDGINIVDHRGANLLVSRKMLQEIITERLKDILSVVKTQLNNNKLYDIINSGIVITGGCALLPEIQDFASKFFNLPVNIGIPNYTGDFADILANPKYATVVGSLLFANDILGDISLVTEQSSGVEFNLIFKKIKHIFKNM